MKILITVPFTQKQKERLQAQMPGADYTYTTRIKATDDQIREADIILGNLPVGRLSQAAHLKWLQLNSSGADAYAADGVLAPETALTNATGAYGLAISEHLLATTFFLKKKLGKYYRNQKEREWKDEGQVTAIAGSRTLVLGLGSIGGDYARKMALLGSRVIGIRRTKAACPDYLEEIGTFEDIDRFLPEADIVAMALPNTPQTYHIMNEERLSGMKRGSILLNVGRGTAIDQDAALRESSSDAAYRRRLSPAGDAGPDRRTFYRQPGPLCQGEGASKSGGQKDRVQKDAVKYT